MLLRAGRVFVRVSAEEEAQGRKEAAVLMGDLYLLRAHRSVPMDLWLAMERELCHCEALCECGWDDLDEEDE